MGETSEVFPSFPSRVPFFSSHHRRSDAFSASSAATRARSAAFSAAHIGDEHTTPRGVACGADGCDEEGRGAAFADSTAWADGSEGAGARVRRGEGEGSRSHATSPAATAPTAATAASDDARSGTLAGAAPRWKEVEERGDAEESGTAEAALTVMAAASISLTALLVACDFAAAAAICAACLASHSATILSISASIPGFRGRFMLRRNSPSAEKSRGGRRGRYGSESSDDALDPSPFSSSSPTREPDAAAALRAAAAALALRRLILALVRAGTSPAATGGAGGGGSGGGGPAAAPSPLFPFPFPAFLGAAAPPLPPFAASSPADR